MGESIAPNNKQQQGVMVHTPMWNFYNFLD